MWNRRRRNPACLLAWWKSSLCWNKGLLFSAKRSPRTRNSGTRLEFPPNRPRFHRPIKTQGIEPNSMTSCPVKLYHRPNLRTMTSIWRRGWTKGRRRRQLPLSPRHQPKTRGAGGRRLDGTRLTSQKRTMKSAWRHQRMIKTGRLYKALVKERQPPPAFVWLYWSGGNAIGGYLVTFWKSFYRFATFSAVEKLWVLLTLERRLPAKIKKLFFTRRSRSPAAAYIR